MSIRTEDKFLNQELASLEAAAIAFANQVIPDAKVRNEYIKQTRMMSAELAIKVNKNQLSPKLAAEQANAMRNTIMEALRGRSSSMGVAIATFIKKEGKTLSELEAKYAERLYGKKFSLLAASQKDAVWRHIVKQSGSPQVAASNAAKWMGHAGRGLFLLTMTIAVYHVATADDKIRAAANEGVALGGGLAGAAALGTAGLACGPAAVACVPLGVFVGGILGAFGADWAFDQIWK